MILLRAGSSGKNEKLRRIRAWGTVWQDPEPGPSVKREATATVKRYLT